MAKKVAAPTITGAVALKLRNKLGLSQGAFWNQLGVTQSGGSRYESDRNIPRPVKKLFFLTFIAPVTGAPILMPGQCAQYEAI